MSDNKKYYYMKLKEDFYETDAMIMLEGMENGYKYSNILMKLYCRSLRNEGRLAYNDKIPYNSKMLAQITRMDIDVVEKALRIFNELELIEILDNGAIYMMDIQKYIGHGSTEGERKARYREQIKNEKQKLIGGTLSLECPEVVTDIRPPEIKDQSIENKDYKKHSSLKKESHFSNDSIEFILSKNLLENIKEHKPDFKQPNLQEWAKHMDYLLRLDNKNADLVRNIIIWCQKDSFWQTNILSTKKLRAQFETLEMQSKKPKSTQTNKVQQHKDFEQPNFTDLDDEKYLTNFKK